MGQQRWGTLCPGIGDSLREEEKCELGTSRQIRLRAQAERTECAKPTQGMCIWGMRTSLDGWVGMWATYQDFILAAMWKVDRVRFEAS